MHVLKKGLGNQLAGTYRFSVVKDFVRLVPVSAPINPLLIPVSDRVASRLRCRRVVSRRARAVHLLPVATELRHATTVV